MKKKEIISMPLPIDNLFGETVNHAKEIVILLAVLAAIWISWVLLLLPMGLNYITPTVISVVFFIFWLSEIFGHGKSKRAFYKRQLSGDLAEEGNIIGITMIDGQDVFYGSTVTNYIVGEFAFYIDGNQLTLDFESFLDSIAPFFYNLYFCEIPVEDDFTDDITGVKCYNDRQVAQERFDFYLHQQDVIQDIKKYTVIIAIHTIMDNIDILHEKVENILLGTNTVCFSKVHVAKGSELSIVLGSDLDYEQDIQSLLDNKYYNKASMSSLTIVDRG